MHYAITVLVLLFVLVKGQYRDVTIGQGVVRGYTVDDDEVFSFYGIPYATAPTGEDRFKAPLPPPTWDDVFNATENFIICPQSSEFSFEVQYTLDCLRAHVFVPNTTESNLPVLFFIHGGAFQFGYPQEFAAINLVKRGMIVVNFNYRVGVYGLLCLNTEYAPGNSGMKDQVAALKWVKENIASFGGDPDNITIGGASAGSFSVGLQIVSPMSNGLFVRAASESGGALGPEAVSRAPLEIAEIFAQEKFNVTTGQDVNALESFYRSLSDDDLYINYSPNYIHVGFSPCVETHNLPNVEKFLTEFPVETITNGNYEHVTYLSGFTPMEGFEFVWAYDLWSQRMQDNFREFLPAAIEFDSEEEAVEMTQMLKDVYFPTGEVTMLGYIHFFSDSVFGYAQYAAARLHARHSMPVYLYVFNYNGTINLPGVYSYPLWGPGHVAMSLYLQEYNEAWVYDNMTEEEYVIQDRLLDIYFNFVKYGVPRTDLIDANWVPASLDNVEYLHMQSDFVMEQFPLRERFEAWDRLYKYAYVTETDSNETDAAVTSTLSIFTLIFSLLVIFL